MLVHVSLHDSQVPYWEGAKFVARLREMKTDTLEFMRQFHETFLRSGTP